MDGHRPPFTLESAQEKVRLAEDVWNSRNPERVSLAYTYDSFWRNRGEFIVRRDEAILLVVKRQWGSLHYRTSVTPNLTTTFFRCRGKTECAPERPLHVKILNKWIKAKIPLKFP
ncbi:DUF1348 family protein [Pectobacterium brasiliense]|uniref:DUF1348 family protein n=1 Tax=Pectobacterium brasiliense TaxID=180957 RepID=UPI0009B84496